MPSGLHNEAVVAALVTSYDAANHRTLSAKRAAEREAVYTSINTAVMSAVVAAIGEAFGPTEHAANFITHCAADLSAYHGPERAADKPT